VLVEVEYFGDLFGSQRSVQALHEQQHNGGFRDASEEGDLFGGELGGRLREGVDGRSREELDADLRG
jgi:hypothetical protein